MDISNITLGSSVITSTGKTIKVSAISPQSTGNKFGYYTAEEPTSIKYATGRSCSGIVINAERLLAVGFKQVPNKATNIKIFKKAEGSNYIVLTKRDGQNYFNLFDFSCMKIQYVHQLQYVLNLCGLEQTANLF